MAIILHIDSSVENASVCIAENGIMSESLVNRVQKDHAAFLHLAIKEILTKKNINIANLDAIAVASGPGSYTGLRVGFAAAKGLAFALKKPLISVGTLKIMAKAVIDENGADAAFLFCPMIDARRNEVYTALYDADLKELTAPHAMILNDENFDAAFGSQKIFFFGNGAGKLENIFPSKTLSHLQSDDNLQAFCKLAFEQFSQKDFADEIHAAPLYAKEFYNG